MKPKGPLAAAALAVLVPLTLLAGPVSPAAAAPEDDPLVRADLLTAYGTTLKYHRLEKALEDGYVPFRDCVALAGEGAMGYHYVNPAYNNLTDPTKPAALMYEKGADGSMTLVGVEWFVEDADQDLATDDDRPSMFGQPFIGPSPGVVEGMKVHYDLHVWLHKPNPKGLFHEWNPDVTCPSQS
ncbi:MULTISPECIES: hypothetical protein [Streptomyces]|uniref:Uncharacterized protein n=3 Tax=Streptomyces TaxID=1883 RepID=A0A1D8G4N1_9ACTN|nr:MULTISPECIES: hypothetical protein [Streptomyces]AOT60399.1 hypothetical protein A4G23_03270 [Streptomyces rubrolavendulae]KAF0650692.1 hypothetical protein K701_06770 [Streptomyces fradiae ATCC 10745 = DSM 40063]OSY48716.1 hypothetical protein BG846_05656 [Streptomyces fradiae ATCC 10745 = DSM 40063]QEV13521.1 hypothetical protein CP974_17725 [Streptomyces fradiae ATCC 10745 = DSM 40063]UQS31231.1 hypothetical protein J5J01_06000 [Streptomyces fradiae]